MCVCVCVCVCVWFIDAFDVQTHLGLFVVVRFGVKEEYMLFMNEFVEGEIKNMKEFINRISVSL